MGYEVFYLVNFYLCTPEYTLSRYFFHSTCYLVFTISLKNPKLSHFTNPFKSKILKLYLFLNLNFKANNDFWLCNSFDFWMQKRRPFLAIFKLCATIFSFWVMNHDHVFRLWQSWQGSRPSFCWSFGWWSLDAIVSSGSLTSRTTTKPNFKRNWFIDWKVNFYIIINEKNPTFFCILDFHRSPLNFVTGTLEYRISVCIY